MTKAKISEYDAVASNNTDVNGVNIAENCPPSGMNNMGREIMAALKRFQTGSDGDGVTVGGNLVVSGTSTVNTFTAGPVSATTLNTSGAVVFNDAGADVDFRVEGDTDANLLFVDAGNDRVAIGTSSPSTKLHIAGTSDPTITLQNTTGGDSTLTLVAGGNSSIRTSAGLTFYTNTNDERARITSGGYFKATSVGGYVGSASAYHEIVSATTNTPNVIFTSDDGGFVSDNVRINVSRSATSAYNFLLGQSSALTTPDTEFLLRGDGNAYADGSWNGSGADYAEYFESAGETIPRGTTVVLDNNKVRAATENDPASSIIGVVRPKEFGKGSMVVGNLAWNMWTDKYITDDFGVYEMEDHDVLEWEETITDEEGKTSTKSHSYESHAVPEGVTVPADATRKTHDEKGKKFQHRKLNPAWSADVEYTPREERPEWHIIGLLGQVPVLKGQPVGDRWIKMRDVSETVEEWMIR